MRGKNRLPSGGDPDLQVGGIGAGGLKSGGRGKAQLIKMRAAARREICLVDVERFAVPVQAVIEALGAQASRQSRDLFVCDIRPGLPCLCVFFIVNHVFAFSIDIGD